MNELLYMYRNVVTGDGEQGRLLDDITATLTTLKKVGMVADEILVIGKLLHEEAPGWHRVVKPMLEPYVKKYLEDKARQYSPSLLEDVETGHKELDTFVLDLFDQYWEGELVRNVVEGE